MAIRLTTFKNLLYYTGNVHYNNKSCVAFYYDVSSNVTP